jgi:CRISP-associated protein Cas1
VRLREATPRSWLRFANRNKGAQFLGNKHASHPINAMLNYAYVVEAGRLAKALAARGLALPIGFLHSDRKGRNSLVWDAIEPLRPAIDARVFAYVGQREFARSDFPQTGTTTFRLSRDVIQSVLDRVSLSPDDIADAADFMLRTIERHSGSQYRLFKADLGRRKRVAGSLEHAGGALPA